MPIIEFDQLVGFVYRGELDKLVAAKASGAPLSVRDSDKRTLLMHAVLDTPPQAEIARWLATNVKNLDSVDGGEQWTALHFAARDHKVDIVRILLDAGAHVDPVNVFGNTPLFEAVLAANSHPSQALAVAAELVRRGADPQRKNKSGSSPHAVAETMGNKPMLATLKEPRA